MWTKEYMLALLSRLSYTHTPYLEISKVQVEAGYREIPHKGNLVLA